MARLVPRLSLVAAGTLAASMALAPLALPAAAKGPKPPKPPASGGKAAPAATTGGAATFDFGQLQSQTVGASGCGTNPAGEPSIHVSKANLVLLGSENGLGGGSQVWRGPGQVGGAGAVACNMPYAGQPNATGGVGLSGGDIDTAIAPAQTTTGTYRIYVASLNLGSVNVATSTDDGVTWSQTPVQAGLPGDDREWVAAYGPDTSLLTFHDIATDNIDVLKSTNGGALYTQVARAIPDTDYKSGANELGNIVIDHVNASPTAGGFWAYQSFVAPSTSSGSDYNEAFVSVSQDGGSTWNVKSVACSTSWGGGLDHNFPNISVAPNGTLFYAVSNDKSVYVAMSADHGDTWQCSGPVSTSAQAIYPWLVATSVGEDLVYYGAPTTGSNQTWYVYFAQNLAQTPDGWTTTQLMPVHTGQVCEGGVSCSGGRQLFDDFGVDTDQNGWAHIAYSHDSPDLGGAGTYTGYAVQTGGSQAGYPN